MTPARELGARAPLSIFPLLFSYFLNFHFRERLAMAFLFTVAGLAMVLENDFLPVAALAEDLRLDRSALHGRHADIRPVAVRDKQHLVETDRGAFSGVQLFNTDSLAGRNAILLPARLDDRECFHGIPARLAPYPSRSDWCRGLMTANMFPMLSKIKNGDKQKREKGASPRAPPPCQTI